MRNALREKILIGPKPLIFGFRRMYLLKGVRYMRSNMYNRPP